MKKLDLQKVIREEVKKALVQEGYFTTYLKPEEVESLKAVVTKLMN